MNLATFVLVVTVSGPKFDDAPIRRAGFHLLYESSLPDPRIETHFNRLYARKADGARFSIGFNLMRTERVAKDLWRKHFRLYSAGDPGPSPLPSGKPIGQDWRFSSGKGGGNASLTCIDGRTMLEVRTTYPRVRRNGRAVWAGPKGDSDLTLIETIARRILKASTESRPKGSGSRRTASGR